jgi:hypothetical protein
VLTNNLVTAELISRIIAIGCLIDAGEMLSRVRDYGDNGVYSWKIVRTGHRWSTVGPIARVLDFTFSVFTYRLLNVSQVVASLALLSLPSSSLSPLFVAWLFVLRALNNLRHEYGLDGSDQMTAIILGSLTLFYLSPTHLAQDLVLWFITFQSLLAYLSSGTAKIISPVWRSGRAFGQILNTQSYGSHMASKLLRRFPILSQIACWSVMAFQISFPVMALSSTTTCKVAIVLGIAFHLGIAIAMGLNNFVWSFTAAYPAVWKTCTDLSFS